MHDVCILLYIHVTVLYYILSSFEKIKNVNVNEVTRKQSMPDFTTNEHFLPP